MERDFLYKSLINMDFLKLGLDFVFKKINKDL